MKSGLHVGVCMQASAKCLRDTVHIARTHHSVCLLNIRGILLDIVKGEIGLKCPTLVLRRPMPPRCSFRESAPTFIGLPQWSKRNVMCIGLYLSFVWTYVGVEDLREGDAGLMLLYFP